MMNGKSKVQLKKKTKRRKILGVIFIFLLMGGIITIGYFTKDKMKQELIQIGEKNLRESLEFTELPAISEPSLGNHTIQVPITNVTISNDIASIKWIINKSGNENYLNVSIEEINDTASRVYIGFENNEDKMDYMSALLLSSRDITSIPITKTNGISLFTVEKSNLDLSKVSTDSISFVVTYPELVAGIQFKIGWESVLISSDPVTTALQQSNSDNVVIDTAGNIFGTYIDTGNDVHCVNSSTGGASWTDTEIITGTIATPGILVTPNNTLAIYYSNNSRSYITYSKSGCGGFGNPTQWEVHAMDNPSCVSDSNDNIHCTGSGGGYGYYINSSDWTDSVALDAFFAYYDTCDIEVDSNDDVYIACSGDDQDDIEVWGTAINGWGFGNNVKACADTSFGNSLDFAIHTDGTMHITWIAASDLQYTNSTISTPTAWSCQELDNTASAEAQISVTNDGDIFILYGDSSTFGAGVEYIRMTNSTDGGKTWATPQNLIQGGFPHIAHSYYPTSNRIDTSLSFVYLLDGTPDSFRYDTLSLPSPIIDLDIINPSDLTTIFNSTQNTFFNITINVTCRDKDCGEINVSFDPSSITYTEESKTVCEDGLCKLDLFSGVRFVQEDGSWKNIEDARSLKGTGISCVVNEDSIHKAECLDWNYTSVTLNIGIKDVSALDKDVPIKVLDYDGKELSRESMQFNSLSDKEEIVINTKIGDEIHIGEESTTIVLNETNSGTLADIYLDSSNPTKNYGSTNYLTMSYDKTESIVIKWNLSSVSENNVISSELGLYLYQRSGSGNQYNISVYKLSNSTWEEGSIDYANFTNQTKDGIYLSNTSVIDSFSRKYWNVNGSINRGENIVTYYLNLTAATGTSYISFQSKEGTPSGWRPQLTLIYDESKGLINTTEGATPFYTNLSNPYNISLNKDESEVIVFWVNATGNPGNNYTFFVYANLTSNLSVGNITKEWNVTIQQVEVPDETAPNVTNLQEPTDPSIYGGTYQFNATVNDISSISAVLLEFNGTNYTAILLTGNVYNVTIEDLSATNYTYKWYANDSSNNANNSETGSFNVSSAIPEGSLSGTSSITYGTAGDVEGTESNLGDDEVGYTLFRNNVSVSNPDTTVLGVGSYLYRYNATAGINYTDNFSMATFELTVTQGTGEVNGTINGTASNLTAYNGTGTLNIYLNASNITGNGNCLIYVDGSSYNNGTCPVYNVTNLSVGLYNITFKYWGNENYSSSSVVWWINNTVPDTTSPVIIMDSPSNVTYNFTSIDLNVSADEGINTWWYSNDSGVNNNTFTPNQTYVWDEGDNTVYVWANDTSGNIGRRNVTFYIDSIPPTFDNLANQTIMENESLSYDIDATDTGIGLGTFSLNQTTNFTINSVTGVVTNTTGLGVNRSYWLLVTVNDSFDNKVNGTFFVNVTNSTGQIDFEAPNVTNLQEPTDPSTYSSGEIYQFNATVVDGAGIDSVLFEISGVNYTALNITSDIYNVSLDLGVGNYTYRWYANDSYNNVNNSETGSFNITGLTPTLTAYLNGVYNNLTITYPQPNNASGYTDGGTLKIFRNGVDLTAENGLNVTLGAGNYYYLFNVTGNQNYTDIENVTLNLTINKATPNVELYIDGAHSNEIIDLADTASIEGILNTGNFGSLNLSIDDDQVNYSTTENVTYTFDPVTLGEYVVVLNYSGDANYTSVRINYNITVVHPGFPTINITYPITMQYYSLSSTDLNYTIIEPVQDSCWYSNNSGIYNSTAVTSGVNWTGVPTIEGENTWTVYCNDSAGNIGQDSVSFYIDTTPPTFDNLANQTTPEDEGLSYNIDMTDGDVGEESFILNDTTLFSIDISTGVLINSSTLIGQKGLYYLKVTINDTLNNQLNGTFFVNVTDATPPNLSILTPTNNSNLSNNGYEINYTVSDDTGLSACWWTNNSGVTNNTITCNTNITGQTWDEGTNTIRVYANDTFNNENSSSVTFNIDTITPTFDNLRNFTKDSNKSFSESITATDSGVGIGSYSLNQTANFTINSSTGLITNSTTLYNYVGIFWLNISVNDTLGNTASGEFFINITEVTKLIITGFTIRDMYLGYDHDLFNENGNMDDMYLTYDHDFSEDTGNMENVTMGYNYNTPKKVSGDMKYDYG